jgi:hypothetical protein
MHRITELRTLAASQSAIATVHCSKVYSMQTFQTMHLILCAYNDPSIVPGGGGFTRQMWQMKLSSLSSPGGGDSSLTGRLADRCCAASRAAAAPTSSGLCASSMATSGLELRAAISIRVGSPPMGIFHGKRPMRYKVAKGWSVQPCQRQGLSRVHMM